VKDLLVFFGAVPGLVLLALCLVVIVTVLVLWRLGVL
jgi:hypothetical protein